MGISNIINLIGGLGLFLFGMRHMSDGLNQVAGNKMKVLLEKLTRNRFKGFLLGVLVTAVIQSSSATTVMLMGFLNAGIMDLAQATGVIIGANIGTTVTAILIAIDVSAIAPICIIIGVVMSMFCKKQTQKYIGQIILGFGILFFGLKYMSGDSAMGALKDSEAFQSFITSANNPFLGLVIGIIMCSVLQSSSAAIGVLQVLALQGLMPLNFAIYRRQCRLGYTAVFVVNRRKNKRQACCVDLFHLRLCRNAHFHPGCTPYSAIYTVDYHSFRQRLSSGCNGSYYIQNSHRRVLASVCSGYC